MQRVLEDRSLHMEIIVNPKVLLLPVLVTQPTLYHEK